MLPNDGQAPLEFEPLCTASWSIRVEIWLALSEGYIPVHSQSRALWTLVTLVPQSHPTID